MFVFGMEGLLSKIFVHFRVDDPIVIPFTLESPFISTFKKSFETMRRVGVLTDIMRRYRQSETSVCGSPKVRNQKKLHFSMFIFYFYLQVSLGLKQLKFLIAILVIGILISLILCSIEKVYHVFKRKNTVNTIEIQEYPNQENNDERRMILQHFQEIRKISLSRNTYPCVTQQRE